MISKNVYRLALIFTSCWILSNCSGDELVVVEQECSEDVAYTNGVKEILDLSCAYVDCHDGGAGAPGDFTNYNRMSSYLTDNLFVLRTINVRDMPPNYSEGPKSISQEQLDVLTCWIENDYKN